MPRGCGANKSARKILCRIPRAPALKAVGPRRKNRLETGRCRAETGGAWRNPKVYCHETVVFVPSLARPVFSAQDTSASHHLDLGQRGFGD